MNEREVIWKTALFSRLLIIFMQYISNVIIPDHEADGYRYPKLPFHGVLDDLVNHFFGGFVRWDAQYFMHISRHGYTYEHTLAFFPFCPYLVRFVTQIVSIFVPFFNLDSLTLLVFIFVNTFCFIQSALCLYELSRHIFSNHLAYRASILFCYNPASIFFSAPYTECIFSYLTFKSMLNCVLLYKKYSNAHNDLKVEDFVYLIPISLSTLARSNGVLNIGFLIYTLACLYLEKMKLKKQIFNKLFYTFKFAILTIILIGLCLLPFICFEIYSYILYCKDFQHDLPSLVLQHEKIDSFVLPGTFSKHNQSWCFKKIPLAYSYIQSHYWEVGFLQYFQLRQIPNFLLASPLIFMLLNNAFSFFKQFPKDISKLFNFNLLNSPLDKKSKFSPLMIVFVIHSTALTLFCIFNIHVQVTTRMLCSASPVLYWFFAYKVSDLTKDNLFKKLIYTSSSKSECVVITYFLSYFVVGTVMFCNYLPWT